ncbi:MAG: hypothetical protein HKL85_12220 [Acidimicrobiaceae bacterium]|nr:hypothetical protein [Acidimicrobiaceae bacterium]
MELDFEGATTTLKVSASVPGAVIEQDQIFSQVFEPVSVRMFVALAGPAARLGDAPQRPGVPAESRV